MAALTTLSLAIVIVLVFITSVGISMIIYTLIQVLREKQEKRSSKMPELSERDLINIQTNSLLSQLELNLNHGRINTNNSNSNKFLSRISSNSSFSVDNHSSNNMDNSTSSSLKKHMNNRPVLLKTIASDMDDYIEQGRISSADLTLSHKEVHRQHDRAARMSSSPRRNNNHNDSDHVNNNNNNNNSNNNI